MAHTIVGRKTEGETSKTQKNPERRKGGATTLKLGKPQKEPAKTGKRTPTSEYQAENIRKKNATENTKNKTGKAPAL